MRVAKKDLWLIPGEICIVRGNAVAKNLMFESKNCHQLFLKLWDRYLGNMTEVLNYHLSPDGWTILFKAKSELQITEAYLDQRKKSRKANSKLTLKEPKRMLSEHIRIFLSQYVRKLNRQLGRRGGLVLERFRKYIIKRHADYQRIFELLSNKVRFNSQKLKKYQADESEYDREKEMNTDSIWQVGNRYYDGVKGVERVLSCMRIIAPNSYVLRNFFQNQQIALPNRESP